MDPPVSVPMEATAEPSCTLAELPLDEPPVSACGFLRLHAVAVLAVLAGDAVSQLMQMGLAHDHGAGLSQPRSHGGVGRRDAVLVRIEMRAASGRVARDIEAILNPDGNAEERRPLRRLGKAGSKRLRFRQYPFAIHRQIHIPPGVAVSARQRFLRLCRRLVRRQGCLQWGQERHIGLCIPCPACTRSPENDLNFPMTVEIAEPSAVRTRPQRMKPTSKHWSNLPLLVSRPRVPCPLAP